MQGWRKPRDAFIEQAFVSARFQPKAEAPLSSLDRALSPIEARSIFVPVRRLPLHRGATARACETLQSREQPLTDAAASPRLAHIEAIHVQKWAASSVEKSIVAVA